MREYTLDDFDDVPSAKDLVAESVNLSALPPVAQVIAEASWTVGMMDSFSRDRKDVPDRSAAISAMAYSGAEMGWTDEQIAAVIYDMDLRWGKYTARRASTRDKILLNCINRAREKYGYSEGIDIDLSLFRDPAIKTEDGAEFKPGVYGVQDFLDQDFTIEWELDGLLSRSGLGLISGDPGVGKTQLCIQLGMCMALGEERFLQWENKAGKRKVLFLSLEMAAPPLHLFMSTIVSRYPDRQTLNQNFKVLPEGLPLALDKDAGRSYLENLMSEYMPDLVIIDSLQRSMSKEMTDELSSKGVMEYLSLLRRKYKCSVLMVHHNRKRVAEAKQREAHSLDDVYGSRIFSASVDFVLSLSKKVDGGLSLRTLKNRLGREADPIDLERDSSLHFSVFEQDLLQNFEEKSGLDV